MKPKGQLVSITTRNLISHPLTKIWCQWQIADLYLSQFIHIHEDYQRELSPFTPNSQLSPLHHQKLIPPRLVEICDCNSVRIRYVAELNIAGFFVVLCCVVEFTGKEQKQASKKKRKKKGWFEYFFVADTQIKFRLSVAVHSVEYITYTVGMVMLCHFTVMGVE